MTDVFSMSFARIGTPWVHGCLICLGPRPRTKEHVPQQGPGGWEMTTACEGCSDEIGSRAEVELQDWLDHALVDVRFPSGRPRC